MTTTLDELDNDGFCSLREALQAANTDTAVDACTAGSGIDDVISVPAGHYLLALVDPAGVVEENANLTGDLDILESVALIGAGPDQTIIDGNQIDRVFHQPLGGTQVSVSSLTVQGGNLGIGTSVNYSGGGFSLISGSALTLTDVLVIQNQASPGQPLLSSGGGGGVFNNGGQLTLLNSRVQDNQAGYGGGIYNGGKLTMANSTVLSNQSTYFGAGLIHTGASDVNVQSSTISQNTAGSNGGGLYLTGGTTNLTNVTISHNRANSYLGGGIWVYYEGILAVNIDHSTIYANFAGTGGGIYNTHQQGLGTAGLAPDAPRAGLISLKNSIIAANTGGNCGRSLQTSAFVSLGHNIDGANDCEFQAATDQINTDPVLGPLQDNGGPTPTHGLAANSPAIDTGDCTDILGNSVLADQRGVDRPQGDQCDSGSFESVPGLSSDLRIEKIVSAAVAGPLEPLTYTVTVFNDGPDLAAEVTVTDTLPAGLTGVTAVGPDWSCQMPAGLVVCAYGPDLPVGAASDLILQATTPNTSSILTNTAVVTAPNFDIDLTQNQAEAVTVVTSVTADLAVTQTITPALIHSGDVVTITLRVTNGGPDQAENLSLENNLPAKATLLAVNDGDWQCGQPSAAVLCTLPLLETALSTSVEFVLQVGLFGHELVNETAVSAATADPNSSNNQSVLTVQIILPPRAYLPMAIKSAGN